MQLDHLQQDHAKITEILQARRDIMTETLPIGVQIELKIYFMILEDALSALISLIQFLTPVKHEADH